MNMKMIAFCLESRQKEKDEDHPQQRQKKILAQLNTSSIVFLLVGLILVMIMIIIKESVHVQYYQGLVNGIILPTKSTDDNGVADEENNFADENVFALPILGEGEKRFGCKFCEINSSPPILHEDKNYVMSLNDGKEDTIVTPMTITYNYELFNGEMLFTLTQKEKIPNLNFDYVILAINGLRNINRETNQHVSLDEVYFHHMTFNPFHIIGAEVLTRNKSLPYMKFPNGYGIHVIAERTPDISVSAHLISNIDLSPIDDSITVAHKKCNECYYSPSKGSLCKPDISGSFACCGNSMGCIFGERCACGTNDVVRGYRTITKYQVQLDVLISRDVKKFKHVDQMFLYEPNCHINLKDFEKYKPGNFCYKNKKCMYTGDGLTIHNVELQDDDNPYVLTCSSYTAPTSGKIVWAQSHMHSGGVNATLRINGENICSSGSNYGTNRNKTANIHNEANHLIQLDSCYDTEIFKDGGVHFNKGDVLTSESINNGGINDDRMVEYGGGGEHKNVMSIFFFNVVFDDDAKKTGNFQMIRDLGLFKFQIA